MSSPPVMHVDQLPIDTAQVAALIARDAPHLAGRDIRPVESAGTVNAIFRVGDDRAARFPLQPDEPIARRTRLEREQRRSRRFHRVSPLPAPMPQLIGSPGAGYPSPWTMQTWIEGDPADHATTCTSDVLADDVVALLRALRAVNVSGERSRGYGRGDVLAPFDEYVRGAIARSTQIIDADAVTAVWDEVRDLAAPTDVAYSHTDLIPGNLLLADGRLAGVIDTGDASPADAALDLVVAWHMFDAERRERVRSGVGVDEAQWQRGRGWALVQAIGLGWYYAESNPTMAELGRSTLARVVAG